MAFFDGGPNQPRSPHEFHDFRSKKPEPGGGLPKWLQLALAVATALVLATLLRWIGIIGH